MEVPQYEVTGTNKDTNRRKKVVVRAFTDVDAEQLAFEKGILPPYEIEVIPPEPATMKQIDYARDLGIPIPLNATKNEMSMLITYKLEDDIDFSNVSPPTGQGWERWTPDLHQEEYQIGRQLRAKSSQYMPVIVFSDKQEGVFKATERQMHYFTTLEECQCPDYMRRGKPCKHMYRLAHELGLFDLNAIVPTAKKSREQATDESRIKKSWYKNPIVIVLLLIFVYPIGVVLYWKYIKQNRKLKIAISVICGIIWFSIALGGNG